MTTYNIYKTSDTPFGRITKPPCKNARLNPVIQDIFDKYHLSLDKIPEYDFDALLDEDDTNKVWDLEYNCWQIEIDTLDVLQALLLETDNRIVLSETTIEIYDSYRE